MQSGVTRMKWVLSLCILLGCLCLLAGCFERVETSWSPDGDEIAYFNENGVLRFYDVDTKQTRFIKLTPTPLTAPFWSPDGTAIAYYSLTTGKPETVSLRVLDTKSRKVRTLASDLWPVPQSMAEVEEFPDDSEPEIPRETQVQASADILYAAPCAWKPDGRAIAAIATSLHGAKLLAIDYPSGIVKSLIEDTHFIDAVTWSPDGNRIAYIRSSVQVTPEDVWHNVKSSSTPATSPPPKQPEESTSLWFYDLATHDRQKICDLPDNRLSENGLTWSADSTRIGFLVDYPNNDADYPDNSIRAIGCVVDVQPGAQSRQILWGLTPVAAWAPGLRGVSFIEERDEDSVVQYKGLNPRTLKVLGKLPHSAQDTSPQYSIPQFSPDGRKVAVLVHEEQKREKVVVMEVE